MIGDTHPIAPPIFTHWGRKETNPLRGTETGNPERVSVIQSLGRKETNPLRGTETLTFRSRLPMFWKGRKETNPLRGTETQGAHVTHDVSHLK